MNSTIKKTTLFLGACMAFQLGGIPQMLAAPSTSMEVMQQTKRITGTVKDATGMEVIGANVIVKGTTNGVITDLDGKFSLEAAPGSIIEISYIGYMTQEIPVTAQTSDLQITLKEDSQSLDEVVVVGYGVQKKKLVTGATLQVKGENIQKLNTTNPLGALQSQSPGVNIVANSGQPGKSFDINIRGAGTNGSTTPLYIIDGVEGDINSLSPADIESLDVLKDAASAAIYGSRAANGVVLITTKRGRSGENKISYNGYLGVQQVQNPFDFINAKDYMNLQNALFQEIEGQEGNPYGVYTPSQLESDVDTDWIDVCTRLGLVQDHSIQFRGGSEKTKILTSLGYYGQEGVLKNTDFSRFSGRVNVDQTITDWIKAGATMYAHREQSKFQAYSGNLVNSNVLYSIMTYDPTVKPFNEDGTYGRPPGGRGDNPLANLMERQNDETNDKFNGTAFVEVSPLEGLTGKASVGVEILHQFRGTYLPKSTYQGGIDNGVATTYDFTGTRQVFEGTINYMKTFNKVHDFNAMLGYTYEKYVAESRSQSAKGFSTDLFTYNNMGAAAIKTSLGSSKTENILVSFFGRVNYTYNNKYLATVTVRRDGSSRFGANEHWGTFPSGSLAWRASEEDFIKNLNLFSNLKVRAGFGVTGNERIGDYASYALMSNTRYTFDGSTNSAGVHMNQSSAANPNLKWETTKQWNVGVDMGFLDNRISVTLDGYWKKTDDLLLAVKLPMYTGFTSGQSNIGSIQNRGFELDFTSHNLTGDFIWDTKFNFSLNRNKVLDLGDNGDIYIRSSKPMGSVSEEDFAIVREGERLGSIFGYKYIGVLQQGETYAPQPNSKPGDPKFEDVNKDGIINSDDRTIIGHANPDFIFGLTNNFAWKNFDLSIFFQGSIGNDLLNMSNMNLEWKRTTDALNRWTPENTNTDIPRNGFYYSQYGGYVNDHFVEDASFLRLKNLTFGYTIPFKKFVSSCRVYFSAENLFTITGYSGWDPETDTKSYESAKQGSSSQSANAGAGLDFNSYPSMRTYTFGLNITF